MLPFELDGRQQTVVTMLAFWVIEKLDVIKDVLPSFCAVPIRPSPDPFPLEELEKAFRDSIIVTAPPSAHAGFQIVGLQELLPLMTGKLASLV